MGIDTIQALVLLSVGVIIAVSSSPIHYIERQNGSDNAQVELRDVAFLIIPPPDVVKIAVGMLGRRSSDKHGIYADDQGVAAHIPSAEKSPEENKKNEVYRFTTSIRAKISVECGIAYVVVVEGQGGILP